MKQPFYNTISLEGEALQKATARALAQDRLVEEIFKSNKGRKLSPSQIQKIVASKYDRHSPITSWRRSITNLTKDGKLIKMGKEDQVTGIYASKEHTWMWKEEKDQELQEWFTDYQNGKFDAPQTTFVQKELF